MTHFLFLSVKVKHENKKVSYDFLHMVLQNASYMVPRQNTVSQNYVCPLATAHLKKIGENGDCIGFAGREWEKES